MILQHSGEIAMDRSTRAMESVSLVPVRRSAASHAFGWQFSMATPAGGGTGGSTGGAGGTSTSTSTGGSGVTTTTSSSFEPVVELAGHGCNCEVGTSRTNGGLWVLLGLAVSGLRRLPRSRRAS